LKEQSDSYRFLLATLQTKYVLETRDAKQRRYRLRSLPATPENVYREILEDRLTEAERMFAKQILSWVFYARRPLKILELQEALAIDPSEPELIISDAEDIVRSCGSLVKHDRITDKVEFTHELVRKFIEDHRSEFIVKESEIALTCLACIKSITLHQPFQNKAVALFDYARGFWGDHVRNTKSDRSLEVEIEVFETFGCPLGAESRLPKETSGTVPLHSVSFVHSLNDGLVGFILTKPLADDRIAEW
jgi:hypothetical protein